MKFVFLVRAIIILTFLYAPVFAQQNNQQLKRLDRLQFINGLSADEAHKVSTVFSNYTVVDLEASNLHSLRSWLDLVNQRLTTAVETLGEQYPIYRIEILASKEANAFILKAKPDGQMTYKGFVFLSIGLFEQFAQALGTNLETIGEKQMELLLDGITGVLAHEFAHPKQDELVKFDWRKAVESKSVQHAQADEATTDILSIKILREAKLKQDSVYTALKLLFAKQKPSGNKRLQVLLDAVSTHPEADLRLNIAKSALTHFRQQEGRQAIVPIMANYDSLRTEFSVIESGSSLRFLISKNRFQNLRASASELEVVIETMKRKATIEPGVLLDYWELIAQIVEERKTGLTVEERKQFVSFYNHLKKNSMFNGQFLNNIGYIETPGVLENMKSLSVYGLPSKRQTRKIQTILRRFDEILFSSEEMRQFIVELKTSPKELMDSLFCLQELFPQRYHAEIERAAFDSMANMSESRDKINLLLNLWSHILQTDGSAKVENEIFDRLFVNAEPKERAIFVMSFIRLLSSDVDSYTNQSGFAGILLNRMREHTTRNPKLKEYFYKIADYIYSAEFYNQPVRMVIIEGRMEYDAPLSQLISGYNDSKLMSFAVWSLDRHTEYKMMSMSKLGGYIRANPKSLFASKQLSFLKDVLTERETDKGTVAIYLSMLRSDISNRDWARKVYKFGLDNFVPNRSDILEPSAGEMHYEVQSSILVNETNYPILSDLYMQKIVELYKVFQSTNDPERIQTFENWIFQNQYSIAIKTYKYLFDSNLITAAEHQAILQRHLYKGDLTNITPLSHQSKESLIQMWRTETVKRKQDPKHFIKLWLLQHDLQAYSNENVGDLELEKNLQMGLRYERRYTKGLGLAAEMVVQDFERDLTANSGQGSEVVEALSVEWVKMIFNPDEKFFPVEQKAFLEASDLDLLAKHISKKIPFQQISEKQRYWIWRHMSSRRANRYTDDIFETYVQPYIDKMQLADQLQYYGIGLEFGSFSSERVKHIAAKPIVKIEMETLLAQKGKIPDQKAYKLVERLQRYMPQASRFRDEILENIAWTLELNESQLRKFIEPVKSFNYKAMNTDAFNVLSAVSSTIKLLSVKERMRLLRFIDEPNGALSEQFAVFKKLHTKISDTLDVFIRDASDSEKLVLFEVIVGSASTGLWHQGPEVRKELYALAGFDSNIEKLKLFETYISVLPEYEHSITYSYLLANKNNGTKSELLAILELFGAPGIKFAQMASILQTFGEEKAKELARAKNQASPPSRFEIFSLLRARNTSDQYGQIESLQRLLGSGGIKYVVLVTFKNGERVAVSVKRPFLEERIADTLELAERWVEQLQKTSEFQDAYDYRYYLDTLRAQLKEEVQFPREFQLTVEMKELYNKVPTYKGWKMQTVEPIKQMVQTETLMHFRAIEHAKSFEQLSNEEKTIVSKYILQTEMQNIFRRGVFDADRHMGNYLFDPVKKIVYILDLGQTYKIKHNSVFRPGDVYHLSRMIQAFDEKNPTVGAKLLVQTLVKFSDTKITAAHLQEFQSQLQNVLAQKELPVQLKMVRMMSVMGQFRMYLPAVYSLGMFKGLMILLNEDYTRFIGREYAEDVLRAEVQRQIAWGARFPIFEKVEGLFGCDKAFLPVK